MVKLLTEQPLRLSENGFVKSQDRWELVLWSLWIWSCKRSHHWCHACNSTEFGTEALLLLADLGRNSSLQPNERDPSNGGVLDCQSLAFALERVEWTPELKDGRVLTFCKDGQRLSHWKAEEFSKFILVAPVILRNLIPKKSYDCFCLLKDIYNSSDYESKDGMQSIKSISKSLFGCTQLYLKICMASQHVQKI